MENKITFTKTYTSTWQCLKMMNHLKFCQKQFDLFRELHYISHFAIKKIEIHVHVHLINTMIRLICEVFIIYTAWVILMQILIRDYTPCTCCTGNQVHELLYG